MIHAHLREPERRRRRGCSCSWLHGSPHRKPWWAHLHRATKLLGSRSPPAHELSGIQVTLCYFRMNLTLLLSVLQILACLVKAAPQEDPEERPRKQVKELEKQYQQYVEKTLKARKSGCTWDNVIRRQEW